MLLGRELECALVDRLIEEARLRRSAAFVIRGEPGIGKTALLQYAESRAKEMRVLRAAGVESESKLPFAALHELLLPALPLIDNLPSWQRAALTVALALGPPVRTERLAINAAALTLLAEAAEESGLLCVIDDAHWIDSASAEAILFASRRIRAEGVLLLMSAREGDQVSFEAPGVPEIRLGGLHGDAANALLAESGLTLAPGVAERLVQLTGGNPLALKELPGTLTAEQRSGRLQLTEPLPVGTKLQRAFLGRTRALSPETQTALLVAATSHVSDLRTVTSVLRVLGLNLEHLQDAEAARLVTISGGNLLFLHPLVRSVIYGAAEPAIRRAVHRAFATASGERSHEARAWHLGAAATEADEDTAAALELAAEDAIGRGAPASAARSYERAAALTPTDAPRVRRLFAAANASWSVGDSGQALRQLDAALAAVADPVMRGDIQRLRGHVLTWTTNVMEAHELLVVEAMRVAPIDRDRAAVMMSDAVVNCVMAADAARGVDTARRATELAADGRASVLAFGVQTMVFGLQGNPRARDSFARFRQALEANPSDIDRMTSVMAQLLISQEVFGPAAAMLDQVLAGRNRGIVNPFALAMRALASFRVGRWDVCYAEAAESVDVAQETGQQIALIYGLTTLARIEATTGREHACRGHVTQVRELIKRFGVNSMLPVVGSIVGLLELGLGRPDAAVTELKSVARLADDLGIRSYAWAPDLFEAYVRTHQTAAAANVLSQLEEHARISDRAWAHAASARCRGLMTLESEFETEFQQALRWHDPRWQVFERARTQMCYGERLRRAGRRVDSREQLRAALAAFETLGAEPWVERARVELRATGERIGRRRVPGSSKLTAQEQQVVLLVAAGGTNREVGARLLLSPRTIEFHLRNAFAKLGVRTRTELAARLTQLSGTKDAPG